MKQEENLISEVDELARVVADVELVVRLCVVDLSRDPSKKSDFALATNSDGQDATAWACVTTRERCNLFDVLLDRLRDLLSLQKIKA
eukprot:CAMPEP_0194537140 /NCGR_PEP_ID=MMETSP0253-20130528/76299_1 /TAXON_ID=2966 /ORGANISM="Noctiluca scintillans" /LENGTH=86 /DNA_ID=CAMNT_0039383127 /DNA_START=100 /DNA_END=361 /DNA_ORIENTATION=-